MDCRGAKAPRNDVRFRKFGFTLAEVLITLGIIGIVAALTMPVLMHHYKKRLIETRLTQTIAIVNQLLHQIEANEGNIDDWSYWNLTGDTYHKQREFAQNTVMKYLPNAKLCKGNQNRECFNKYVVNGEEKQAFELYHDTNKIILPNGSGFWLGLGSQAPANSKERRGMIFIDLNISKNKMYYGVDFFKTVLMKGPDGNIIVASASSVGNDWWSGWNPYIPKCGGTITDRDGNRLDNVQLCKNKDLDNYYGHPDTQCTALIECNGWKIPDNYPIKF